MNKRLLIITIPLAVVAALGVIYWARWGQPIPTYHQPLRSFSYVGRYGTGVPTFAPNSHMLAILTEPKAEPQTSDFTAVMIDADTGRTGWIFPHVGSSGYFSADGKNYYSLGKNSFVCCDMSTGKEQVLVTTKGTYQGLSHDFRLLLVDEGGVLILYDTRSGRSLRRFPGGNELYGVALSRDAKSIAVASIAGTSVVVYDVNTGAKIAQLETSPDSSVAFSQDGTHLVTVSAHHPVTVWETTHWTRLMDLPVENYIQVWGVYFTNNSKLVVAGQIEPDRHNINEMWDVGAARRLIETPGVFLDISRDGRRLVTADDFPQGNSLTVTDLESGRGLFRFYASHGPVVHPCFSYDGTLLAECANDDPATYEIWRVP